MRPAARLQATIDLLDLILVGDRPADTIVSDYFKKRRYAGSKDRRAVQELLYTVLRHRARLAWRLNSTEVNGRNLTLSLLTNPSLCPEEWQDDLAEYFNDTPHAPAPLSAEEQTNLTAMKQRDQETPPSWVPLELPEWLYTPLDKAFGADLPAVMAGLNSEADLDLRINSLHPDAAQAKNILQDQGVETQQTPLSPLGLRTSKKSKITGLEAYKDGLVDIQDEGSQLVSALCDVAEQEIVMDFCAGAGGKTLALAAAMGNQGALYALDVAAPRLYKARKRLERSKVTNTTLQPIKDTNDPWLKSFEGRVDRLLIDAPCSGVGSWRRSPESRWTLTPELLAILHERQRLILNRAADLVKVGGRLIYATCSLLPSENQDQIAAFLEKHKTFQRVPMSDVSSLDLPTTDQGDLLLRPDLNECDGFFCAILEKTS